MKHIYEYLIGGKKLGQGDRYKYSPTTYKELIKAIETEIELQGDCADLNCIDTSNITDMCSIFSFTDFNGDISKWDVSNVKNMNKMFYHANHFNGDISKWDVSNVEDMSYMFANAESFNQDLSKWDVSNVEDMHRMFAYAKSFNQDISKWDVGKVTNMECMFYNAKKFNQDISEWNVNNVENMGSIFYKCPIKEEYKPKFK